MQGSGRSRGWLVHLMAGAALGAVAVLVVWIFSGGRPFGEVVGSGDVSSPTPAAVAKAPAEPPADTASRLISRPPAIARERRRGGLRFMQPKAERKVAAKKPKRPARRRKARRGPVVRVVAPAEQQTEETPVVALPSPEPTATPTPAPPRPPKGGGGGSAKPKPPGPTIWTGEG